MLVGALARTKAMLLAFEGDPKDEDRMRIGATGPRQIIQWINKGWTAHELTLPVIYRESLARILCLERFRNLIETNIEAGITLYTNHKPALFENSLSNKGQLSAWKLAEVADLLSIVENLYRQGGKMLFADPLSRVCVPTEGWFNPFLPRKLAALFEHLLEDVRNNESVRVYAGKDTYAAGRLVQKWRKPSNRISQGKLLTKELAPTTFHIGVDDVNKCVSEVTQLIKDNKYFAILMPVSVTSEIARLENKDGQRCHDKDLALKVSAMSKITLASSAGVWLISLTGEPFNHFINNDMEGLGLTGCQGVFQESSAREKNEATSRKRHYEHIGELDYGEPITLEAFPVTRSRSRVDTSVSSPVANSIVTGERSSGGYERGTIIPVLENQRVKWKNIPKQPIPELQDVNQWIGAKP
jgi:hypothetical protein